MKLNIRLLVTSLIFCALTPISYAAKYVKDDESVEIENAKISLIEAITIAEKSNPGKAFKAKFKNSKHGLIYEIEIAEKGKAIEIKVDAATGSIITSKDDTKEHDRK